MPQCSYHSNVETNLACGKCGRYICPKDMVQTPVGARCRECARLRRLPTFEVRVSHYLVATAVGLVAAVALGAAWGYVLNFIVGWYLLPWLVVLAIAYGIGEAISWVVNRKRGSGLALIAAGCTVIAIVTGGLTWNGSRGLDALLSNILGVLILIFALIIAANRVR